MHKLPADIQRKLKYKFPDVKNLDEIINLIFESILEKSFDDGSCSIQTFGTFYSYKAYSNKRGTYVPRFKFRISRALTNQMCDDEYMLQRIDKVLDRMVDAKKKFPKEEMHLRRNLNYENQNQIINNQREVRKKTKENIAQDEINKILTEEFSKQE